MIFTSIDEYFTAPTFFIIIIKTSIMLQNLQKSIRKVIVITDNKSRITVKQDYGRVLVLVIPLFVSYLRDICNFNSIRFAHLWLIWIFRCCWERIAQINTFWKQSPRVFIHLEFSQRIITSNHFQLIIWDVKVKLLLLWIVVL